MTPPMMKFLIRLTRLTPLSAPSRAFRAAEMVSSCSPGVRKERFFASVSLKCSSFDSVFTFDRKEDSRFSTSVCREMIRCRTSLCF